MKYLSSLIIALIFINNIAVGQKNITIKGTTENAVGRKIELYKTSDQISKSLILLDSFRIGDDQHYDVRCWTNYPMMVTLQIENYSQSFYVEPGRDYVANIPFFDWNIDETRNVFLDPEPLPLLFQNIPTNDINLQIDSIDRVIARFIDNNYFYFDYKFHPAPYYFDSLVHTVYQLCPDTSNDFVNRYKTYQLAELEYTMHFDSRKNIINKYIKNHPILYYDENYMSLFTTLYANTISKGTRNIPIQRLAHWVYNLDLDTFIDSIGTDPMLRHEQIRDLAALQALYEAYFNFKFYDADMVVKMIEKLATRTKFQEHKTIAIQILNSFNRNNNYNPTESFTLLDINKKPTSIGNLKNKWTYLAFIRVSDPLSISEMETIAHFKKQIYSQHDNVEFITVVCDREFQKMFHFLKNTKHGDRFDWTWLHFNGNYELLNKYQICTYPWFVLINPNGEVQYDVTPAPSTGFLMNAPWNE